MVARSNTTPASGSKERRYNNARTYLDFIAQFPRMPKPRVGRFVCFTYNFHTNPYYIDHPEKKKYLDFQPFDLVIAVRPKKGTFMCVNFHHLPVITRQIFLAKLKKDYDSSFDRPKALIPGINYKKLFKYLKKIGVAVRNYRFERVMALREVPSNMIDETMRFYANFYYKSTYKAIVNRYLEYKPTKPNE